MKRMLMGGWLALLPALGMAADTGYHLTARQVLPGNVQWDYVSYEAQSHRLFLTRGDHVDVVDTQTGKVVGSIPGTHGVHGVALAPELDRAFVTAGKDDAVTIVELSTLKVLGTVPTEQKPDAIVYDPASKRAFAANGGSGSLTAIDAVSGKVVGTVAIGGKLEFAAVDGKGGLFVNVEDKGQLAAVDTQSLQLKARYGVLKDRQNLKFAALNCWQLIADQLPAGTSIQRLNFADGKKLTLSGTAAATDISKIIDFNDSLRKATVDGEPMFDPKEGDAFMEHTVPGGVAWSFGLVLKHGEESAKR